MCAIYHHRFVYRERVYRIPVSGQEAFITETGSEWDEVSLSYRMLEVNGTCPLLPSREGLLLPLLLHSRSQGTGMRIKKAKKLRATLRGSSGLCARACVCLCACL